MAALGWQQVTAFPELDRPEPRRLEFTAGTFLVDATRYTWTGLTPTPCRSCLAPILFVDTVGRRRKCPLNPDGTTHFETCPSAAAWRR
jgi:hypothetical protein